MPTPNEQYLIDITLKLQGDKTVQALTKALEDAGRAAPKAQKAMKGAAKDTRAFGRVAANAGYQVQDFIVQVQGGVDPIRALGQQLPQLFIGFGALGSAIGVVAALLPSLIQLNKETADAAEDAGKSWDEYREALERWIKTRKTIDAIEAGLKAETALKDRTDAIAGFREELQELADAAATLAIPLGGGSVRNTGAITKAFGSLADFERYQQILAEMNDENIEQTAVDLAQLAAGLRGLADPATVTTLEGIVLQLTELNRETAAAPGVSAETASLIAANDYRQMLEEIKDAEYEALQAALEADKKRAESRAREAEARRRELLRSLQPVRANRGNPELNERFIEFQRKQAEELKRTEQIYRTLYPAAVQYADATELINQARERGIISEERYQAELAAATKTFEESTKEWSVAGELINTFDDNFTKMLDGVLMGTQDLAEGFEDMAKVIIAQLLKLLAYKAVFAGFGIDLGLPAGATGNAKGNVFSGGNVVPFANGGIVNSPTMFPMKSGVGLMGEAGPEAIVPLRRGAGGDLGIAAAPVNVVVNNMASGVRVNTRQTDQGLTLDVVMEQVSSAIRKGGNSIANAMEDSYSLGRGRAVY